MLKTRKSFIWRSATAAAATALVGVAGAAAALPASADDDGEAQDHRDLPGDLQDLATSESDPFEGASAKVRMAWHDGHTRFVLRVWDIDSSAEGTSYGAHLHEGPCVEETPTPPVRTTTSRRPTPRRSTTGPRSGSTSRSRTTAQGMPWRAFRSCPSRATARSSSTRSPRTLTRAWPARAWPACRWSGDGARRDAAPSHAARRPVRTRARSALGRGRPGLHAPGRRQPRLQLGGDAVHPHVGRAPRNRARPRLGSQGARTQTVVAAGAAPGPAAVRRAGHPLHPGVPHRRTRLHPPSLGAARTGRRGDRRRRRGLLVRRAVRQRHHAQHADRHARAPGRRDGRALLGVAAGGSVLYRPWAARTRSAIIEPIGSADVAAGEGRWRREAGGGSRARGSRARGSRHEGRPAP